MHVCLKAKPTMSSGTYSQRNMYGIIAYNIIKPQISQILWETLWPRSSLKERGIRSGSMIILESCSDIWGVLKGGCNLSNHLEGHSNHQIYVKTPFCYSDDMTAGVQSLPLQGTLSIKGVLLSLHWLGCRDAPVWELVRKTVLKMWRCAEDGGEPI